MGPTLLTGTTSSFSPLEENPSTSLTWPVPEWYTSVVGYDYATKKCVGAWNCVSFDCKGGAGAFVLSVFHKLELSKRGRRLQNVPLLRRRDVRTFSLTWLLAKLTCIYTVATTTYKPAKFDFLHGLFVQWCLSYLLPNHTFSLAIMYEYTWYAPFNHT